MDVLSELWCLDPGAAQGLAWDGGRASPACTARFWPGGRTGLVLLVLLALVVGCGPESMEEGRGGVGSSGPRRPGDPAGAARPTWTPPAAEVAPFSFADATAASGLHFRNVSGSPRQDYVLESMSAGAAFADYDADGYLDLFVVNGTRLDDIPEGARNRLFHSEPGAPPGKEGARVFREVATDLGEAGWGMGCAVGDYDNDGDVDFYATYWGPNRLYRNDGDGRFARVAEQAGVADWRWGSSAAFGDVDADGYLDLYVTNYLKFDLERPPAGGAPCFYRGLSVFCGPGYAPRQSDRLYRNRGEGRFEDVSDAAGVGAVHFPAMGVVFFDFDGDGDADIYVTNDTEPNLLLRNDGEWRLTDVATQSGVAYSGDGVAQASMGVHAGDYDNDGDQDLFATAFSDDLNVLYRNDGDGLFQDATHEAGLAENVGPYLCWATGFADFDSDGWLDLFVASGHLYPQLDQSFSGLTYAQRNLLFHNRQGRFAEVGPESGSAWGLVKSSRAAAVGDYDNDGDVDLLIMNMNDISTLLRNDTEKGNNWLGLALRGKAGPGESDGAQVWVRSGGREQVREVHRGYGFQAANDPRLLVGLGQARQVEQVEIRWPSGRRQVLVDPPLGSYLTLREGAEQSGPRATDREGYE